MEHHSLSSSKKKSKSAYKTNNSKDPKELRKKEVCKKMGFNLLKLRQKRYQEDSITYSFCRSQLTFAEQLGYNVSTIQSWERGVYAISHFDTIRICELLHCSFDYLCGLTTIENKDVDTISKETGLSPLSIHKLKDIEQLPHLINKFISSEQLYEIIENITKLKTIDAFYSMNFEKPFSKSLQYKIRTAFNKYRLSVLSLEKNIDDFSNYLRLEIPYNKISNTEEAPSRLYDYLKDNLSQEKYNQLFWMDISKNSSDIALYNLFISDLSYLYEVLEYSIEKEHLLHYLYNQFVTLMEE